MAVQSKRRQAACAGAEATGPPQFERHEVGGLLSVAHLFPRSSGRTGIYVLHFQVGDAYVGQSLDVVGRWAAHRRRWDDITRIDFCRAPRKNLDITERELIRAYQQRGQALRNITHTTGSLVGDSDLDYVIEPSQQHAWLNDGEELPDVEERVRDDELRNLKRAAYARLTARDDFNMIQFVLNCYVQLTVPRPRATELTFWALSAMPSTNASTWPRVATLSVNKMETLVMCHPKGAPQDLRCFINISGSALQQAAGSLSKFLKSHPAAYSDGIGRYESSGGDALTIQFEHPWQLFETLLSDDSSLLNAARSLNLQLMRKGPTVQWRGHCFDLADHVVTPLDEEG
jgi:hypothetical protein